MKKNIFRKSFTVFLITLIILMVLIASLQYVGVYVIYVGLPILLLSGFLAYITRPQNEKQAIEFFGL